MIASLLTNSLNKRAKALHLPLPWTAQRTPESRTRWRDREGIAARMARALEDELESRRGEEGAMATTKTRDKTAGEADSAHRFVSSAGPTTLSMSISLPRTKAERPAWIESPS